MLTIIINPMKNSKISSLLDTFLQTVVCFYYLYLVSTPNICQHMCSVRLIFVAILSRILYLSVVRQNLLVGFCINLKGNYHG